MTSQIQPKSKLFLIDGNGLAYRAFYAVPPTQAANGTPTHAVAGFFELMLRLLAKEKPTHVAVAFDKGVPTERVADYHDFNAQRVDMPEDLASQLPAIEDMIRALGIQVYRVRGHQGDDCLGTIARQASEQGMEVLILSGDLDLLQLVGPHVQVMTFRRGLTDLMVYDEETVRKRFNLLPYQLADLRALAGDSSENITGVPGIGEVTAKKLLSQHGSLDDLLNSLDQLPAKWRNPLSEHRAEALDFRTRAAIRTNLDLQVDWAGCEFQGIATWRVRDIFARLELTELLDSLLETESIRVHEASGVPEVEILVGKKGKTVLGNLVKKSKEPIDLLLLGSGDEWVGVVLACGDESAKLVPFQGVEGALTPEEVIKALKPALRDPERRKNVHNLRAFLMMELSDGLAPDHNFFDVAIASHLIDSVEGNPWFDEICRRHGIEIPGEGALLGRGERARKLSDVPVEELGRWAGLRIQGLRKLAASLENRLRNEQLWEQFTKVDQPLAWIYAQMERNGACIREDLLDALGKSLKQRRDDCLAQVQKLGGGKFDVDDPRELAEVLFDKLGLAVPSRPKNGSPIGPDVVAQVAALHPIGDVLRDYRSLRDLLDSFNKARPLLAEPRYGWFHRLAQNPVAGSERLLWMGPGAVGGAVATFNRLLGEIELLPNASYRQEFEEMFLKAMVARDSKKTLLGVSYTCLPLRIAAHLSQDQELIKTFLRGEDAEQVVASLLPEESGPDSSREILDVLLGSTGRHRFAQSQGLSLAEAGDRMRASLQRLYERFPGLHAYVEGQLNQARTMGWVSSIRGRRRNLPEMSSRNSDIRSTAERVARSAAVQASAADILKAALVEIYGLILTQKLPATFALQLRDEVVLEVEPKNHLRVLKEIEKALEARFAGILQVPLQTRARLGSDLVSTQEVELAVAGSC
jgi:DNA polymerase-1